MGLRGIFGRQPNPNSILRHPLPPALPNRRDHPSPPNLPARIRLKQPPRHCIRLRQNPISPLLLLQRHPRIHPHAHPPDSTGPILTKPPGRPRKLYPSKPTSNPAPHQTRVILPIRLRHPAINPEQTRRRPSTSCLSANPILNSLPPQIEAANNDVPTTFPTPILNLSSQSPSPHMSRKPTC